MSDINPFTAASQEINSKTGLDLSKTQVDALVTGLKGQGLTAQRVGKILTASDIPKESLKGKARVIADILNGMRDSFVDLLSDEQAQVEVAEVVLPTVASQIPVSSLQAARDAYDRQEYELALNRYRKIAKEQKIEGYLGMAHCFQKMGKNQEAFQNLKIVEDFCTRGECSEVLYGEIIDLESVLEESEVAVPAGKLAEALNNEWIVKGDHLMQAGEFIHAINCYMRVYKTDRSNPETCEKMGAAYKAANKTIMAIKHFYEAYSAYKSALDIERVARALVDVFLTTNTSDFLEEKIHVYGVLKMYPELIKNIRLSLRYKPAQPVLQNSLSWMFSTFPDATYLNPTEAIEHGWQACEYGGATYHYLDTLAAGYARNHDYTMAIVLQERALAQLRKLTPMQIFERKISDKYISGFEQRLALYKDQKPYTDQDFL